MNLFILICILVVLTVLSTAYLHEEGNALAVRTNNEICVYDFVHQYLPNLSHSYRLYDWFLLVFLSPLLIFYGTYDFCDFVYSLMWLLVPLFIFRCFTTVASIPTRTCNDIDRDFGGFFRRHIFGSSSDLNFSGHLAFAFSLVLLMLSFGIIENKVLWLSLLGGYGLFSSMSRSHYSIDILVAFAVVPTFFDWTVCKSASKDLLWGGCEKKRNAHCSTSK